MSRVLKLGNTLSLHPQTLFRAYRLGHNETKDIRRMSGIVAQHLEQITYIFAIRGRKDITPSQL